jgi:hypothetical protein
MALLQAGVSVLLLSIPFLVIDFPPITDLAQHTAQLRLLQEALDEPAGLYRIQWLTPYSLQYAVLGLAWLLSSPEAAGRLGMLTIGILWVGATHLVAWRRQRPLAAAALASALFFTHTTYWGFYSFALGWPTFALWFLLTTSRGRGPFRVTDAALFLGGGTLLYLSHVLWLAAGMLWFVASTFAQRVPWRTAAAQLACISPVLIAAAVWYPQLAAGGFGSATVWASTPTARLSWSWIADAALGGLRGPWDLGFCVLAAGWAALALASNRTAPRGGLDRQLLLAGAIFLAMTLLLPDKHTNTIHFASRWMPVAATSLLLAMPPLSWRPVRAQVAAVAILAAVSLVTASTWRRVEREEYSGLAASLASLPPRPRVIGLDFVKESRFVKGRPFLQTAAYAQVLRGGTLNFSFAEFAPSLVVYRSEPSLPWTRGLEWFPDRLRVSDLRYFSHALVNATEQTHARFAALPGVSPVTSDGRWRLYRIAEAP